MRAPAAGACSAEHQSLLVGKPAAARQRLRALELEIQQFEAEKLKVSVNRAAASASPNRARALEFVANVAESASAVAQRLRGRRGPRRPCRT